MKFSSKPFKPSCSLDTILSEQPPQYFCWKKRLTHKFYFEKELDQINEVFNLLSETTEPCGLDMILSQQAPQNFCWKKRLSHRFYCEKELAQIDEIFNLHSETTENTPTQTQTQLVTRKRRRIPIPEMLLDDEEDEAVLAKPAKKKSRKKIASEIVQELPVEIRNRIAELNGTNTQFLMSKKLYSTDVRANNNRLSLPENSIKCEFLINEAQKESTREGAGLEVIVLDSCLREHSLILKKWKMNNVFVYNLIKNWNKVVSENNFQEDDELQIWSFRVNTKLYFVLNKV